MGDEIIKTLNLFNHDYPKVKSFPSSVAADSLFGLWKATSVTGNFAVGQAWSIQTALIMCL